MFMILSVVYLDFNSDYAEDNKNDIMVRCVKYNYNKNVCIKWESYHEKN